MSQEENPRPLSTSSYRTYNIIVEEKTQYPNSGESARYSMTNSEINEGRSKKIASHCFNNSLAAGLTTKNKELSDYGEQDSLHEMVVNNNKEKKLKEDRRGSSNQRNMDPLTQAPKTNNVKILLNRRAESKANSIVMSNNPNEPADNDNPSQAQLPKFSITDEIKNLRLKLDEAKLGDFIDKDHSFKSFNKLLKTMLKELLDLRLNVTTIDGKLKFLAVDDINEVVIGVLDSCDYIKFKEVCAYLIVTNISSNVLNAYVKQESLQAVYKTIKPLFIGLDIEYTTPTNSLPTDALWVDPKRFEESEITKAPASLIDNIVIHADFIKKTYKIDTGELDINEPVDVNIKRIFKKKFNLEIAVEVIPGYAEVEVSMHTEDGPLIIAKSKFKDVEAITMAFYTEVLYMIIKNDSTDDIFIDKSALKTSHKRNAQYSTEVYKHKSYVGSSSNVDLCPLKKQINVMKNTTALNNCTQNGKPKSQARRKNLELAIKTALDTQPAPNQLPSSMNFSKQAKEDVVINSRALEHLKCILRSNKIKKFIEEYSIERKAYNFESMSDIQNFLNFERMMHLKSLVIKEVIKYIGHVQIDRVLVYLLTDLVRLVTSKTFKHQFVEIYAKKCITNDGNKITVIECKRIGYPLEKKRIEDNNEKKAEILCCLVTLNLIFPRCLTIYDIIVELKNKCTASLKQRHSDEAQKTKKNVAMPASIEVTSTEKTSVVEGKPQDNQKSKAKKKSTELKNSQVNKNNVIEILD